MSCFLCFSGIGSTSIEDYLFSDVGITSNIHGEIGLIDIPSSRLLEEGNLKLHLVNSEPVNSMLIIASPFNWMEVSLRYADINLYKYSPFPTFSGNQTYKDKSFNLKLRLIKESETTPELSVGFRDFIGTGRFSGEYIVSSKRIGDFDFTVGLGWGALANNDGLKNPFYELDESFINRSGFGSDGSVLGGTLAYNTWFRGKKASSFYGLEYINKRSGIRFKIEHDSSNPLGLYKKSDINWGLTIPASKYLDINLFRIRGTNLGFGISYKANYSEEIIPKNEVVSSLNFSEKDKELLLEDFRVFTGTMNVLLNNYGLAPQEMSIKDEDLEIIISQSKYRNQYTATKRVIELIKEILVLRNIKNVSLVFQNSNINTNSISLSLPKFIRYLEGNSSIPELRDHLYIDNFYPDPDKELIFKGDIDFPVYSWGISPALKNHVGGPERFYFGQIGLSFHGAIDFDKQSSLSGTVSFNIANNLDDFKLKPYSLLPKVRSNIREYLVEGKNSLSNFEFTRIFKPVYTKRGAFISGMKVGYIEDMYGGIGSEIAYKDVTKPWFIAANFYWVKQRDFNQRFTFRDYETFTGHIDFFWDTPIEGLSVNLSGGRYLAKDSGITLNISKRFKTGFLLGAFATRTDISFGEFGEGSFDKGIYFSIPLDIISSRHNPNNAKFSWRNLTKDGGQKLMNTLQIQKFLNDSAYNLDYKSYGLQR